MAWRFAWEEKFRQSVEVASVARLSSLLPKAAPFQTKRLARIPPSPLRASLPPRVDALAVGFQEGQAGCSVEFHGVDHGLAAAFSTSAAIMRSASSTKALVR